MLISERQPIERQPIDRRLKPAKPAISTAASRLAQLAREQFWAARRVGDGPAMIHWSARESVLRRRDHGVTALVLMADHARAVG